MHSVDNGILPSCYVSNHLHINPPCRPGKRNAFSNIVPCGRSFKFSFRNNAGKTKTLRNTIEHPHCSCYTCFVSVRRDQTTGKTKMKQFRVSSPHMYIPCELRDWSAKEVCIFFHMLLSCGLVQEPKSGETLTVSWFQDIILDMGQADSEEVYIWIGLQHFSVFIERIV